MQKLHYFSLTSVCVSHLILKYELHYLKWSVRAAFGARDGCNDLGTTHAL